MKFLIAGDFVINRKYPMENIEDGLYDLFNSSDFNIVNLEAPVTKSAQKANKTGPHHKAHEGSTLQILKKLNINMVTLANNHILDYGNEGVVDTIQFCEANSIQYVGAGETKERAARIAYLDSSEQKIAFLNFSENEWSSAGETSAGGNGMDLIDDISAIREARLKADFVFVIVHGGHEYYNLPSPRMQKQYRFYIENGADIVVGHHPHCISGSEIFQGKPIFYSLGNFLFTSESRYEDWYRGAVLEVNLSGNSLSTKLHYVQQQLRTFKMGKIENAYKVEDEVVVLNKIIADPRLLEEHWDRFVEKKAKQFANYWSLFSIFGRKIKSLFLRMGVDGLNRKKASLYYNLIRCEAHRDLTLRFFKNKLDR